MNGGMHWEYLIDVRALCVGESNPTPTTKVNRRKGGRRRWRRCGGRGGGVWSELVKVGIRKRGPTTTTTNQQQSALVCVLCVCVHAN